MNSSGAAHRIFPFKFILSAVLVLALLVSSESDLHAGPQSSSDALNPSGASSSINVLDYLPRLMESHDRILSAKATMEAARQSVDAAWGGYKPHLDVVVEGGAERVRKAGGAGGIIGDTMNTQTVSMSQLITDFGGTLSTVERAEEALLQAELTYNATRQQVLLEGLEAYLNLIRFHEQLGYALQSEESIKSQTGMEESLVKRGAGLSSNVLQAKAQLAGANSRRVLIEGRLENAKSRFLAVFGFMPTDEQVARFGKPAIPFSMAPESQEAAAELALKKNPQMLAIGKNVDIAQQDVEIIQARYFPILSAVVEQKRRENYAGTSGVRHETTGKVMANWNLLSGGSDYYGIKAAKETVVAARKNLLDVKRLVREQARVAWQQYITMKANAEFLKNQADITWEFLELARKERKLGNRSLLDVLSGEVTYINATSDAVSSETDRLIAAFQLLYAMGQLTEDVLKK